MMSSHLLAARYVLELPVYEQYMQAFHWATIVTSGAGYDIEAHTFVETLVTTLFILIGIGNDVLLIGLVASALSNIDATAKKRAERLSALHAFMRHKRVPQRLVVRLDEYFDYLYSCMSAAAQTPSRSDMHTQEHNMPVRQCTLPSGRLGAARLHITPLPGTPPPPRPAPPRPVRPHLPRPAVPARRTLAAGTASTSRSSCTSCPSRCAARSR